MFHVYAIYNEANDKIYIGQTANLESRIVEHNRKRGNHYTAKFEGEWVLIYEESMTTRTEAIKREKQLKSHQGRVHLKQFIPLKTE